MNSINFYKYQANNILRVRVNVRARAHVSMCVRVRVRVCVFSNPLQIQLTNCGKENEPNVTIDNKIACSLRTINIC